MLLADLLDRPVTDSGGEELGVVHDVLIEPGWSVSGLVVDRGSWAAKAAHRWGYASGRQLGPLPLRRGLEKASRNSVFVPVAAVRSWGPDGVVLGVRAGELASREPAR